MERECREILHTRAPYYLYFFMTQNRHKEQAL